MWQKVVKNTVAKNEQKLVFDIVFVMRAVHGSAPLG